MKDEGKNLGKEIKIEEVGKLKEGLLDAKLKLTNPKDQQNLLNML